MYEEALSKISRDLNVKFLLLQYFSSMSIKCCQNYCQRTDTYTHYHQCHFWAWPLIQTCNRVSSFSMFTIESFKLLEFFTFPKIFTRSFNCLPLSDRINLNYSALASDNPPAVRLISSFPSNISFVRFYPRS